MRRAAGIGVVVHASAGTGGEEGAGNRRLGRWVLAAALVAWLLVLIRVLHAYGPDTAVNDIPYSSDCAVPVLMANEERPFFPANLYYYGADRWGAWPFALLAYLHRVTGLVWTDRMVFALHASWALAGGLLIGALVPKQRLAASLVYAAVLCLQVDARFVFFEMSQVYSWLAGVVLVAWLALRRLFDAPAVPDRRVWVARAALLGAFLLALATSVSATPFLVTLIALEVVRGWARADRAAPLWPALRWTLGLGVVALGSEWLVRSYYGRYSEERLGLDPRWSVDLDTEFLAQNLRRHLDNLAGLDWWPLYAVAALSPLALVVLSLSRPPRDRGAVVAGVRAALADDVAVLWLGASAIATLHLALVVAADHVRANGHDPRYLALTHQFAPFAGLMALLWLTERAAGPFSPRLRASAWIAGVLLLLLAMPERRPSTQYETVRRIAAALEQRAPGGVLIGSYWQTYVFASLQPRAPMTPVPLDSSRTPWTIEAARRADQVVVEYLLSGLGPLGDPPRRITQQGLSLHLTEPRWYADGGHAFALYRRGGDRLRQDGFEGGDTCRWSRTSGGTGCP